MLFSLVISKMHGEKEALPEFFSWHDSDVGYLIPHLWLAAVHAAIICKVIKKGQKVDWQNLWQNQKTWV